MSLVGKNAVVFGAANKWSLAWAIARAWRQAGASVALVCASEKIANSVSNLADRARVEDNSSVEGLRDMKVFACDVTVEEEVKDTFSKLHTLFDGKLDTLLHSIAFAPGGALSKDYSDVTFEEYCMTQNTTAFSLNRLCKEAKPMLIESGEGSVVTLSFIGSNFAVPNYHVVGVAKSALESSTRYLASEFGKDNVRVNAISPGPINTAAARGIPKFRDLERSIAVQSMLGRKVLPEEVASIATFLASNESSCITGQTIYADCGYSVSRE